MLAAIHIVSESCDHYNLLILIEDINDKQNIKTKLLNEVGEDPYYWSDYYVTTNTEDFDNKIIEAIQQLRNEAIDQRDGCWGDS